MAIFEWNNISQSRSLRLPKSIPGYQRTEKRNRQATSASLLQAKKHSVRTKAIINQIQIWRWCIPFTRYHANQNSYAELIFLEGQSECRIRRCSVSTRCGCLALWKNRGEHCLKPSYRQQIMVYQCLSLVNTDTSTSPGIRNQSCLPSRKSSICTVTFKHPTSGKFYEFMKRARPNQVEEVTRQLLENITKEWSVKIYIIGTFYLCQ